MKDAKKFSREQPCTKVEIHNCFFNGHRYDKRPVIDAKMEIGDNVPKYLVREGFVDTLTMANVDYYVLSDEGEEWLREGLKRYLELHPDRIADVKVALTPRVPTAHRIVRRARRAA